MIGSKFLTPNHQEKSIALVEIKFPVFAVCFSRRIVVFNAVTPSQISEIPVNGALSCLKYHKDNILVAAYTDAKMKGYLLLIPVQDITKQIDIPNCHQDEITSMVFFENKLLTASLDGYLKLWDKDTVKQQQLTAVAYGIATTGISRII